MNGKLHTGAGESGGRVGVEESPGLEDLISKVGTLKKRFKTGTPPRIKRNSIDFSKLWKHNHQMEVLLTFTSPMIIKVKPTTSRLLFNKNQLKYFKDYQR